MRLKTKLVVAIASLVFLIATMLSAVYMNRLLDQHIQQSYESTDVIAHQLLLATRTALQTGLRSSLVNPNDPVALRGAVAASLRNDEGLNALITSIINYAPTVFDIAIADSRGTGLVTTQTAFMDKPLPKRPDYASLRDKSWWKKLNVVFGKPVVYNFTLGLERDNQPFVDCPDWHSDDVSEGSVLSGSERCAHEHRHGDSHIADRGGVCVQPCATAARADQLTAGCSRRRPRCRQAGELESGRSSDAVVQVSHKIERLGRRMRNVEEVFSALKENLDQILSNLQDGIMLFTRDSRAVLVSRSVERFLDVSRDQLLGAEVHDIFDRNTVLGRTVRQAFDAGMSIVQEEITTEAGRRLELSLDFIHDDRDERGLRGSFAGSAADAA